MDFSVRQRTLMARLHRSLRLPHGYSKSGVTTEPLGDRQRAQMVSALVEAGVILPPTSWDDVIEQCVKRLVRRMLGELPGMVSREEGELRRRLMFGEPPELLEEYMEMRRGRKRGGDEGVREGGGQSGGVAASEGRA